jgi:hypothetical protein
MFPDQNPKNLKTKLLVAPVCNPFTATDQPHTGCQSDLASEYF